MAKSFDVCRCCLATGCEKDIASEYYYAGQKEVYQDMILNTFNITICKIDNIHRNQISYLCEHCIQRLRDAVEFKKQISESQNDFIMMLDNFPKGLYENDVKKEDDDISIEDHDISIQGNDNDELVKIENLKDSTCDLDPNPMLTLTSEKDDLCKVKPDDGSAVDIKRTTKNKRSVKNEQIYEDRENSTDNKVKINKRNLPGAKLRNNTRKLIKNSNICVFNSLKVKFQCLYCPEKYNLIKDLRLHYETHTDEKLLSRKTFKVNKPADITNLKCKICDQPCDSLDNLQTHLTGHGVTFDLTQGQGQGHLLVPYRVENPNDLKCVLCAKEFNSFVRLHQHMNDHYPNSVCSVCGKSFLKRHSLSLHVRSIHRSISCVTCGERFEKSSARTKHMQKVHGHSKKRRLHRFICRVCGVRFDYNFQFAQHKTEVHGVGKQINTFCVQCNRSFVNLNTHVRSVHQRERNFQCSQCDAAFFTKTDKSRHERTHDTKPSPIPCEHCSTKFKSRDSWRRHVKKQHDGKGLT